MNNDHNVPEWGTFSLVGSCHFNSGPGCPGRCLV